MPKYKEAIANNEICSDCVGLIKGYAWTNGGEGVIESIGKEEKLFTNKYGSNGMPDESANGMFEYAQRKGYEWGTIDTIPEIPGLAVRYNGHVGVYIGNGEVVEERGFNYGCVKTKLKDRGWLHWYKIPTIIYITEQKEDDVKPVPSALKLGDRLLKNGIKGEDVKELQTILNKLLNLNLKVDGSYGALTEQAVKKFQSRYNLTVDGKYGAKSHATLMSVIGDNTGSEIENETPVENTTKYLEVVSDSVNARTGDSTSYSIITTLSKGAKIQPILDKNDQIIVSKNNWCAVKCADQIGWISMNYIK